MEENKQIVAGSSTLAIVSMVFGILSYIFCLMFFLSVPAVICGHIALSRIKKGEASGKGFAVAGVVLGYVNIAISLMSVLCLLALFVLGSIGQQV